MDKKIIRTAVLGVSALAIMGICAGSAMTLKADDVSGYVRNVAARQTFQLNGETLYYVDENLLQGKEYSDQIVYEDSDGRYFTFYEDTKKLHVIENKTLMKEYPLLYAEDIKPFYDSSALYKAGKEIIEEWFDGDTDNFEWEYETDDLGHTGIQMNQIAKDGFKIVLAHADYDMEGMFRYVSFFPDSVLGERDIENMLSKEEAIEAARAYLEREYGETEWEEITVRDADAGKYGVYWEVTLKKYNDVIIDGYSVLVDIFTGEPHFFGGFK